MEVALCRDMDWLLSEDAFSVYASCMCHGNILKES